MSATPGSQRVEISASVRAIVDAGGPKAEFVQHFVRYQAALIDHDPAGLDDVIVSDSRFHELEAMGLPPGLQGMKMFRHQVNSALPDEVVTVMAVSFEGDDLIDADLVINGTQTGEIFDIPATGRRIQFDVHEHCRFVGPKIAERWATVDFDDIKRQLTDPIQ
jgi:predicted ester cyclase